MAVPTRLIIETTTHCNSQCTMCPMGKIDRPDVLPMDDYCRLIDECKDCPIEEISLTGYGEPLCDTYLEERIAYASIRFPKARIVVFTNGSLMTEHRAMGLLNAGLTNVVFSVDGATKETYEGIRVGLNYEKVVENIRKFIRLNEDLGHTCHVRLHMTLQGANESEMGRFKSMWNMADAVTFNACDGRGGAGRTPNYDDYSMTQGCQVVDTALNVMTDGSVVMCCQDWGAKYPLGNVKEGMLHAWNSERFRKVRYLHHNGMKRNHPLCKDCKTRY